MGNKHLFPKRFIKVTILLFYEPLSRSPNFNHLIINIIFHSMGKNHNSDEEMYTVEKILDKRLNKIGIFFLI
jgi:hypothetical protein